MYKSPFYWPNIVDKFNKAFENPLMENDEKAVGTIFCPVMMIMAVGSQLVAPTEIEDVDPAGSGKSKNLPQERYSPFLQIST